MDPTVDCLVKLQDAIRRQEHNPRNTIAGEGTPSHPDIT
jgi:hypothetical protein